jgi:hypothetical protein
VIGIQPAIPLAAGFSNLDCAPTYRGNFVLHTPPLGVPSPAGGITSDLAAVFCSLVEWLVVSPRGLG